MNWKLLALYLTFTGFCHAETAASKSTPSDSSAGRDGEVREGPQTGNRPPPAAVSSLEPEELEGFASYPPPVQQLIKEALALTKQNLTYTFGSSHPKQGGMDCSGTIYYLLKAHGLKTVPRQSNEMGAWVRDHTLLHLTPNADTTKHSELAALQPGHLLFWSGTYDAGPRELPITHVMLYLGKVKATGKPVVFGASDGRTYRSERRTGVSVFDFSVPSAASKSRLYGYGLIPTVGQIKKVATAPTPAVSATKPTESNEPKEVIQRAIPTPPPPSATKPPTKPKPKPKTAPAKSTSVAKKKSPAKEPTVGERIDQAAQKIGSSLREVFSR
jgi:hypothetical protein